MGRMLVFGAVAVGMVIVTLVAGVASVLTGGGNGRGPTRGASSAAVADIPAAMLTLYRRAAVSCPGLDWAVLAAMGEVETDHGRSTLPGVAPGTENSAGAGVISGRPTVLRHVRCWPVRRVAAAYPPVGKDVVYGPPLTPNSPPPPSSTAATTRTYADVSVTSKTTSPPPAPACAA